MLESQTARIARLGNPNHIWNGQSDFYNPIVFPVLENVVIPGGTPFTCAECGKPLAAKHRWGSMGLADRVVVCHNSREHYGLYHPGCAPRCVRWIHEVGRSREVDLPLFGEL